jgi:ribosomal protein L37E
MTQCINCGGEYQNFFDEQLPCTHCKEVIIIEYKICTSCGMVAKFVDGQLISGAAFSNDDTQQLFGNDIEALINMFEQEAAEMESRNGSSGLSMSDIVHKCIRCDTRSFEKEKGLWHCPECGFEWEVIPSV